MPLIVGLAVGLGGAAGAGMAVGQNNLDSNGNSFSAFDWKMFGIMAVIGVPMVSLITYALMRQCSRA